jgi:DNA-directed RNA polymerase specialized sigma24 family protein
LGVASCRQQLSYAEISVRLGIPVGSIGPNRSRCLAKMRRHPAITALIGDASIQLTVGG